ncbi:MAG: hypothetical protein WA979_13915 [Pacificimonas sp.]
MTRAAPLKATPPAEVESVHMLLSTLEDMGRATRAPLSAVAAGESSDPDAFVADAVHLIAILHGELPSLFDTAAGVNPDFETWLEPAAAAFHADRAWLTELCVMSGPRTDLSGLSDAEALVRGLRDAMLTLAQSSRNGCALGSVLAFLNDWPQLRSAIDNAGTIAFSSRWPAPYGEWPDAPLLSATDAAEAAFDARPTMRALTFGAQQFAQLHGQLLELIAARAAARRS